MLNTLVHNMSIHKGSQWALHNGTLDVAYIHKVALVYTCDFYEK